MDRAPWTVQRALSERELPASAWRSVQYEGQAYALLEIAFSQPVACTLALKFGAGIRGMPAPL